MSGELYQLHRATVVYVSSVLVSFLLLIFQHTVFVREIRAGLLFCVMPLNRFSAAVDVHSAPSLEPAAPAEAPAFQTPSPNVQGLVEDNNRLRHLLDLQKRRWPASVAAQVIHRNPHRWFQEILLDRGQEAGIEIDDPVVSIFRERQALIGRVMEVGPRLSKVMLIQDPLSAVPAVTAGPEVEDGVVEGTNSHDLYLKYLSRSSGVKIGDPVLTSGLGGVYPEGIPIGWVEDISPDPRQLFLQARVRPVMAGSSLRVVLVLLKER